MNRVRVEETGAEGLCGDWLHEWVMDSSSSSPSSMDWVCVLGVEGGGLGPCAAPPVVVVGFSGRQGEVGD